jgi:phage internal scaffolding protein
MSKNDKQTNLDYEANPIPSYVGWWQPHPAVNWTGEVLDVKTGELVKEPSMTKQSFVEECDINNIIKSYSVTGVIQHINEKAAQGSYIDLPDPIDYQESLNIVIQAEQSFATLPSSVRNRFENDPEQFLAFMADPANQDEIIKMGLGRDTRPPPPPEAPQPPPTPESPPEAKKPA